MMFNGTASIILVSSCMRFVHYTVCFNLPNNKPCDISTPCSWVTRAGSQNVGLVCCHEHGAVIVFRFQCVGILDVAMYIC